MNRRELEDLKKARAEVGSFRLSMRAVAAIFILVPLLVIVLVLFSLPLIPAIGFLSSRGYVSPFDQLLTYPSVRAFILVVLLMFIAAAVFVVLTDFRKWDDPRKSVWASLDLDRDFPGMWVGAFIWGGVWATILAMGVDAYGKPVSTYSSWKWYLVILPTVYATYLLHHTWGRIKLMWDSWGWEAFKVWKVFTDRDELNPSQQKPSQQSEPEKSSPLQISRWHKMPLSDKLVLSTLVVVIFFIVYWIFGSDYGLLTFITVAWDREIHHLLVTLLVVYGVILLTHFSPRWQAAKDFERVRAHGARFADAILFSRAEYLDGHPLLVEPQTVDLWLLPTKLVIVAVEGEATIPLQNIRPIEALMVHEREGVSLSGIGASIIVPGGVGRAMSGMTNTAKFLVVPYFDRLGDHYEVWFGYIVPPHTHEKWVSYIRNARKKLLDKSSGRDDLGS